MQDIQSDTQKAEKDDSAYRRGWQQGFTEATRFILQMVKQGMEPGKINQLIGIYQDYKVSAWRNEGDLSKKEDYPDFIIAELEEIAATHPGYNWLLTEQ